MFKSTFYTLGAVILVFSVEIRGYPECSYAATSSLEKCGSLLPKCNLKSLIVNKLLQKLAQCKSGYCNGAYPYNYEQPCYGQDAALACSGISPYETIPSAGIVASSLLTSPCCASPCCSDSLLSSPLSTCTGCKCKNALYDCGCGCGGLCKGGCGCGGPCTCGGACGGPCTCGGACGGPCTCGGACGGPCTCGGACGGPCTCGGACGGLCGCGGLCSDCLTGSSCGNTLCADSCTCCDRICQPAPIFSGKIKTPCFHGALSIGGLC